MGVFAFMAVVAMVLWLVFHVQGRRREEAQARQMAGKAVTGAHNVMADLLGSVGGQDAPDFGPESTSATLEPEGDHVLTWTPEEGDSTQKPTPEETDPGM